MNLKTNSKNKIKTLLPHGMHLWELSSRTRGISHSKEVGSFEKNNHFKTLLPHIYIYIYPLGTCKRFHILGEVD